MSYFIQHTGGSVDHLFDLTNLALAFVVMEPSVTKQLSLSTLDPTYIAFVIVVMTVCADKLGVEPQDLRLQFGMSPETTLKHPNYQIESEQRCFIFSGQSHLPYTTSITGVAPFEQGHLRSGSFLPSHLSQLFSFDELASQINDWESVEANAHAKELGKFVIDTRELEEERRTERERQKISRIIRDRRFRALLLAKQGHGCAVCDEKIEECLDAAHIQEVKDNGSDDLNNGLILCALHHRMFDKHLFGIDPTSRAVIPSPRFAHTMEILRITCSTIRYDNVSPEALKCRWGVFAESTSMHL